MKFFKLFSFLIIGFGIWSCSHESQKKKVYFIGEAQGTYYAITYFDNLNRNFQEEVDSILEAFDQSVSVYQSNSIVSRINRNENNVQLDDWFVGNFVLAQEVSSQTNGSFDITIAPIANIWGFGTYEKPDSVNTQLIDSLKQYVDYKKIKIVNNRIVKENAGIQLNFNAIAQGYAVDVLSDFLVSKQIEDFLIDIGGEIYAKGQKPEGKAWKIGLELPEDNAELRNYNQVVKLHNQAVATSGNYRKFYMIDGMKYAHSLDPKTCYPVRHSLLSVTVIAKNAALADAYATAFMVMGVEETLLFTSNHPEIKAYLMYDENGEVETIMSEGFEEYIDME